MIIIIINGWILCFVTDKSVGFHTHSLAHALIWADKRTVCCCGYCYCPVRIYDFCCNFLFKAIAYFIMRLLAIMLYDDGITLLHVAHTITSCLYAQHAYIYVL